MSAKTDATAREVVDQIKAMFDGDDLNWDQPWIDMFRGGIPYNALTGHEYEGTNVLTFMISAMRNNFRTGLWGTYNQWQELGAQVRKGSKGTPGIRVGHTYHCKDGCESASSPCEIPGHTYRVSSYLAAFTVFNADQVDGFDIPALSDPEPVFVHEIGDRLMERSGAVFHYTAADSAHYRPGTDHITLPLKAQFKDARGYYATVFHELIHFTGDESRLDRKIKNVFGSAAYAMEELVAELGSAFLQIRSGLTATASRSTAAYIQNWLKALDDDPTRMIKAATLADKAAKWLLAQ